MAIVLDSPPVVQAVPGRCACRWCAKLEDGMPDVGEEFPERAHFLNYYVRTCRAMNLLLDDEPGRAEAIAYEFDLLARAIRLEAASEYTAMVQECGR